MGPLATVLAAASAAAILAAGCGGHGGSTGADVERGKRTFVTARCGTCHTLEAAGTRGTAGPRLDGVRLSHARVTSFVRNGGAEMPAYATTLSPREIDDVALFVSRASGG
jgi:sulfite dehydrogenase